MPMRTQVRIVGAGPAGLLLSHLLAREGIESVVLESRSRDYVEHRVRAGVLEQTTVELLRENGLGERMDREGLVHEGVELRFEGAGHRRLRRPDRPLDHRVQPAGGRQGHHRRRLAAGGQILFESKAVGRDLESQRPSIGYEGPGGEPGTIECDVVAGCDGFWGISREAVPDGVLTTFSAATRSPGSASWPRSPVVGGADLLLPRARFRPPSMRSPSLTRLYLQVDPEEQVQDWPDERIWKELKTRWPPTTAGP